MPTQNKLDMTGIALSMGWSGNYFPGCKVWIVKGNPAKFGKLSTADLFPSQADLESVDFDIDQLIEARASQTKRDGYEQGYAMGWMEAKKGMTNE